MATKTTCDKCGIEINKRGAGTYLNGKQIDLCGKCHHAFQTVVKPKAEIIYDEIIESWLTSGENWR